MEKFRTTITVPLDDNAVIEWLKKQNSISHSIRELIKCSIREYGMIDFTCRSVTFDNKVIEKPKNVTETTKETKVVEDVVETIEPPVEEVKVEEDNMDINDIFGHLR